MLESTESLLPPPPRDRAFRTLAVAADHEAMEELERLLGTAGLEVVAREEVVPRQIVAGTYYGKGKLDELKARVLEVQADVVIFDVELSPNQLRNLEKIFERPILDRPGVIIEIFSRNARTRESKTQVSLARLEYLLPRLAHFWSHFERQRGGNPGSRGMGEKQIEVDRRLVKDRIALLRGRLRTIAKERDVQRSGRTDVLKVALVGYTNAGKSTLLNALTRSQVLAEDKLFATLDASVRALSPDSHPPVVAIDTVGFITRLPPSLIASFRSTLEELEEADLLLHVVDGSSPDAAEQIRAVEEVLRELQVDSKPRMTVINKADRVGGGVDRNSLRVLYPKAQILSAFDPEEVERLRQKILEHFRNSLEVWEILVPYADARLEALVHAHGSVEAKRHLEKGTFLKLRIHRIWAEKLALHRYRI